jgi:hypothetical protein
MKPFLILVAAACLMSCAVARAQTTTPDDAYFDVYNLIHKAEALEDKGRIPQAHSNYIAADHALKSLQEDFPLWQNSVVKYRLDYLRTKIAETSGMPKPAPMTAPAPSGGTMKPNSMSGETVTPGDSTEPVTMKIKWNVGKRYHEQLSLGAQATTSGAGATGSIDAKLTQDFAISALKELDGGGRDLQVELLDTTVNANVDQQGQKLAFKYDSKNPGPDSATDPLGPLLKNIAGAKLSFLTDASGNIASVEGLEDFVKTVGGAGAADAEALIKGMPADMNAQLQSVQPGSAFLPDNPVKVGDSWSRSMTTNNDQIGNLSAKITYTFSGWSQHDDHKCAVIEFSGSVRVKPPETPATNTMPADVQADISGKTWFDPDLGTIVETSAKPALKVEVAGGVIKVSVKLDADCKLVDLADIAR